ncbi:MAG: rhomboid family intramembrane serine protease [Myxococcaceae bacterium]|nr:rhomboid family intramembrane serine protease [Myxococcaceae bacterium]
MAFIAACVGASLLAWLSPFLYVQLVFDPQAFAAGEVWRPCTAAFVHASPAHLVLNCVAAWTLGRKLEPLLGSRRLLGLSLAGVLASSAAVAWLSTGATGFSGVLLAWVGACVPFGRQLGLDLGKTLLLNVVVSFLPGVSLAAHLGGFLAGVPLGTAHRESKWAPVMVVMVGVSAVALVLRVLITG